MNNRLKFSSEGPARQGLGVDMEGLLEIFSSSLYGGEFVFLRELVQNAADALRARGYQENFSAKEEGKIMVGCSRLKDGSFKLVVRDNGIGLTREEVEQYLCVLGSSGKKTEKEPRWDGANFAGCFGVGLYSCLAVSQEIAVTTRHSSDPTKLTEWKGYRDGTFSISEKTSLAGRVGTTVSLRIAQMESLSFDKDWLKKELETWFGFLEYPLFLDRNRIRGGSDWLPQGEDVQITKSLKKLRQISAKWEKCEPSDCRI